MATATPQKQQQGAVSVQHVAKASSDELLRKFADPDARSPVTPPRRSLALRRKRSSRRVASGLSARDSDTAAAGTELAAPKRRRSIGGSADWRAGLLLPTTTATASARKAQVRRGGAARLDDAAGIGLLLAALERTWRKTVAGASKMFVERHRTNHVLLISDMPPILLRGVVFSLPSHPKLALVLFSSSSLPNQKPLVPCSPPIPSPRSRRSLPPARRQLAVPVLLEASRSGFWQSRGSALPGRGREDAAVGLAEYRTGQLVRGFPRERHGLVPEHGFSAGWSSCPALFLHLLICCAKSSKVLQCDKK